MNEAARVILTKLTLVDPMTCSFSAYQQSAEVSARSLDDKCSWYILTISTDSTVLEAN